MIKSLHRFAKFRGAGRILWYVNHLALRLGIAPIRTAKMLDGSQIKVDLRSDTEWFAFYSGSYDDDPIAVIAKLLTKSGGGFLDVGGNIGMYSVRVAYAVYPRPKVISFEPMPDNVGRIRENALLNGLQDAIVVKELALSDMEGSVELVLREDFQKGARTGNASIAISNDADGTFRRILVLARRFDDVRKSDDLGPLPVVKLDIEGHEDFFLAGAVDYLAQDRPIIFAEINNWFYIKRGTTSSIAFARSIPSDYQMALLNRRESLLQLDEISFDDLAHIKGIETCVFYPPEKAIQLSQAILQS